MMNDVKVECIDKDHLGLFTVKSSDGKREYCVDIDLDDMTVYCDCPDFKYRRQTERWGGALLNDGSHHCKHIKSVLRLHWRDIKSR